MLVVGCKAKESTKEEIYQDFQKKIQNMKEYTCKANVKVTGNKSPKEYEFKVTYRKPENYKIEVLAPEDIKGNSIIYEKDKVFVNNPDVKDIVELTNKANKGEYLFVGDFISNYFQNEQVEIELSNEDIAVTADISGNSKYFKKQVLYINRETRIPTKLEILDQEGLSRFIVGYVDFKYK
jgi:outer membrane lipoprotein-sorting protein